MVVDVEMSRACSNTFCRWKEHEEEEEEQLSRRDEKS
jgi:hypothetical protein